MKKNLRLLCLGLAAATLTAGFAQQAENYTSKLRNADMALGVKGWGIDGEGNIFGKNTKNQASKRGYHGMNGGVLENWKSDATSGLSDNAISQTVKNLPNGTYVFGAYIGASVQGTEESNKEEVTGVTLFANDATVAVATDNPDNSAAKYAHTAKFNVAATVTDGTLSVGLNIESTNANYVVWDNATLYYFGDMDATAALDEMAKIDMAATVAIADTCFAHKMNADTLALITEAKAAAQAVATADALWQADEDLYWAIFKATRSLGDYRSFNNAIAAAEAIAAGEWSPSIGDLVDALNASIVAAKTTYEEATAARPELNEQKAALNEAAAMVALDSCYIVLDELEEVTIPELPVSDELGEYSDAKIAALEELVQEARTFVDNAYEAIITAVEARHKYDSLYVHIQDILNNPNSVDSFPFTVGEADGTIATVEDGRYEFTSKTYTVAYPLTTIRFTFLESHNTNGAACLDSGKYPQIAIAEFYLYDGDGEQIELTESNFYTNAQETSEGPMVNICDGEKGTFWHSSWSSSVGTYHYLEITLPEGLDLTTFSFGWTSRYTAQVVPKTVEVSSLSNAAADLLSAIDAAKAMNAYRGTAPGFYNADLTAFYAAIANAEALVNSDASDDEIYTAIAILEEEQAKLDELSVVMPEPGKQYRIVSAAPFFEKQGLHKAWTAYSDTTLTNQVWWETAHPDSAKQVFTFEVLPNDEGKNYYIIKNVATGLYVSTPTNEEGDAENAIALFATTDTVELQSLGYGQFGLINNGMIHAGSHNSGAYSESTGAYGGIAGVYSSMVKWTTGAYNASAWYIREMQALPYAAKNISDLNFQSESINLYAGVNTLTLTADKDCAFADLVVYGVLGDVIPSTVNVNGANATVVLDTTLVESFSFAFTNAEGIATVTVNGNVSKLSELQVAYDEAVAVAPVAGEAVMEFKDLAAYNNALKVAKNLLDNGGTDEEIVAAIAALEKAVSELTPNMPEADKEYFIVSALDAFEETHGVKMMMYANAEGTPRWMYENVDNLNRLWKFEAAEVEEGQPAMFYIMNVATGTYFGSSADALVERGSAAPYKIVQLQGTVVAIQKNETDGHIQIHANQHGGGSGKGSNIVYWNSGIGTASAWYICEKEAYLNDVDFEEIEDAAQEEIAPLQKGIYDLFGRRITTPAATGIYIVDGKKRVIKK